MHEFWLMFWLYSQWAVEFLFVPPIFYVAVLLLANVLCCIALRLPFIRPPWRAQYALVFAQFLSFPAIIALAVIKTAPRHGWPYREPGIWEVWGVDALIFLPSVWGVYWAVRMKGLRWFAVSILLLQALLTQGATFIFTCATTGLWP